MKKITNTVGKYFLTLALACAGTVSARAATYTVTNTNDSGAGSLREAITAASTNPSNDTITFAAGANGTITLGSELPAILNNGSLTINGNGAPNTIISGNNAFRAFTVHPGATLTLNGVTITKGLAPDTFGGAILNYGTLTITDSALSDSAANNSGGAITTLGILTVTGSTLSGNSAARGGAIYVQDSTATLTNTTISGNTATSGAGAISNLSGGGGSGSLTLISCTVTGNTGTSTGGVSAFDNGGSTGVTTTLKNTIVANNTNPQLYQGGTNADVVSQGYNLTSDNGSGVLTGTGDQINTNPLLAPLGDNGGPTMTHALLSGSPALDKGFNFGASAYDQRGNKYERTFDYPAVAPASGGDNTDIGAVEQRAYTVTTTADTNDGACDADCSLREAMTAANTNPSNDAITFSAGANGTITLSSELPMIVNNGSLTIAGNGTANTIISGNDSVRIFSTNAAFVTMSGMTLRNARASGFGSTLFQVEGTLTLSDSVISNGTSGSDGTAAALTSVYGVLNLNRVSVTNNNGVNVSGAYLQNGVFNITDSTFSGNSGGGADVIRVNSAQGGTSTLTMVNSTVSGNSATFNNAGITLQTATGTTIANLTNCTITNNSTTGLHGAIWLQASAGTKVLNLRNTIVSGNLTGGVPFDIDGTADASSSFNLIGTGGGLTNGVNSNIVGVNNPGLGPLADNGGPTMTHALLSGSPAIDGALNSNALTTDQRGAGFARTIDLGATNIGDGTDIGAFEAQIEPDGTAPVITPSVSGTLGNNGWYTSNVEVSWSVIDDESTVTDQTGCGLQTVTADTSSVTFTCSATSSGGSDSQSVTIKRDATAPTLAPTVTPNPVLLGGTATAAANATDSLSGIASQSCPVVDTSTVGTRSLTCTATDLAGNSNTANVSYQVWFHFAGFFQPVDNLPTLNIVTAGQAIPLKFSLSGYQGLNILAAGYPVSVPIACDANEPGSTIEETVNAGGSSLSYDQTVDRYSYVWKTNKAWKGTCRLFVLKLIDGSDHYAKFRFR